MKKYYAVKKGRKTGIYDDWNTAQKQVSGYSGSEFRAFNSISEAEAYINEKDESPNKVDKSLMKMINKDKELAIAYVDGSYRDSDDSFSYGAVVIYDGYRYESSERLYRPDFSQYRNVAGELYGSVESILIARSLGAKAILIHHDYEGIGKWANGEWKANNDLTAGYVKFINKARGSIDIDFKKVPAHSGVPLNELADFLAGEAIEIKRVYKEKLQIDKPKPEVIAGLSDGIDINKENVNWEAIEKKPTELISFEAERSLLVDAERVFNSIGITREDAIILFLKDCVRNRKLPFSR